MSPRRTAAILPSAKRLIGSLRDVGYSTPEAVADLVDNSVAAGARRVDVTLGFDGDQAFIRIVDDGSGMNGSQITEAMRYGAERDYDDDDLGKFGLGLKTASMSKCRRLSVASRTSSARARIEARQLDLDYIETSDRWEVLILGADERPAELIDPLRQHTGTVVLWQDLDRILTYQDTSGAWARKRLTALAEEVDVHLGMVFHQFLTKTVRRRPKLTITVNTTAVDAWDPFATGQSRTEPQEAVTVELSTPSGSGLVGVAPYILPPRHRFDSEQAWRTASGPKQWNRQQGFYIYRADRLIQSGGWSGMRTQDEHTKLARIALAFDPELDDVFDINVAKMRVSLPDELREQLEPLVRKTTGRAQVVYREKDPAKTKAPAPAPKPSAPPTPVPATAPIHTEPPSAGLSETATAPRPTAPAARPPARRALEDAAQAAGAADEFQRIIENLSRLNPEVAHELGW